jgi:hypothetical protein
MRIVHGLALVLRSRLVFDDGAIVEVEPARARNADPRHAARLRFLRPFTRRLARAKTSSDVGNGHVRAMNVPLGLETCGAARLAAGSAYRDSPPGRLRLPARRHCSTGLPQDVTARTTLVRASEQEAESR